MARYYNKDEVTAKLRGYIAENYRTQTAFAKHCGVTVPYVSAVLCGVKSIPASWLELVGLEVMTVYKKKG